MPNIKHWSHWNKFLGQQVQTLLLASVAVGVLLSFVEVVFGFLIQSFLTSVGVLSQSVVNLPEWAPIGFKANALWLAGFAVLRAATQWFKVYGHSLTFEAFGHNMRRQIARWALFSPRSNTAQVITFLTDRVPSSAAFATGIQNTAIQVFSLLLLLVYLFKTAFWVAAFGLGTLFVSGLLLRQFNQKVSAAGDILSRNSLTVNEKLIDSLKNLHLLRVCRTESIELTSIRQALDRYFHNTKVFFAVKGLKFAAPQLMGVCVIVLISYFNQTRSSMSAGTFVSFVYLFIRVSQTASDLSNSLAVFRMYGPQWNELYDWWNNDGRMIAEIAERQNLESAPTSLVPASWEIKNLNFSFESRKILSGFNAKIKAGDLIVITGPSGIGKSTLLDLLSGIRKPESGELVVDAGRRTAEQVRFGYVGPEPHVIAGTIRENLNYGLGFQVSDKELIQTLEKARCREFLTQLPRDLEREIADRGEGLSAGQKQRLALARALLRRPEALLLDEPTANLDEASELAVVETLKAMKGQLTIVAVTHRKALLGIADQVIEL